MQIHVRGYVRRYDDSGDHIEDLVEIEIDKGSGRLVNKLDRDDVQTMIDTLTTVLETIDALSRDDANKG